jgi:DHA2 family multidrug resistance protein
MGLPATDFARADSLFPLAGEIARQAMMVSYTDAFWALFIVGAVASPLAFLMRTTRPR